MSYGDWVMHNCPGVVYTTAPDIGILISQAMLFSMIIGCVFGFAWGLLGNACWEWVHEKWGDL